MNTMSTFSESKNSYGIYHDLTINSSIEKVYGAVSEPEHLVNWWPLKCKGEPKLGSEYNFYFTPEYDWYGKVIDFKPKQSFHIKMTKSDLDWNSTIFGFDMEDNNKDSVNLRFFHIGWPKCNSHYRIASFCWAMLLKGLKDYVEKGIILPFEERS